MGISQTRLAAHLRISMQRINELVNGKRGITPDTAWLLAAALNMSPDFWMGLQVQHDLARSRPDSMVATLVSPAARKQRTSAARRSHRRRPRP